MAQENRFLGILSTALVFANTSDVVLMQPFPRPSHYSRREYEAIVSVLALKPQSVSLSCKTIK